MAGEDLCSALVSEVGAMWGCDVGMSRMIHGEGVLRVVEARGRCHLHRHGGSRL